jgi:hypothetical protein
VDTIAKSEANPLPDLSDLARWRSAIIWEEVEESQAFVSDKPMTLTIELPPEIEAGPGRPIKGGGFRQAE